MAGRVRVAALVLTLVLVGALAACGDDSKDVAAGSGGGSSQDDGSKVNATPPPGEPSITGTVTGLQASGDIHTFTIDDGVDANGAKLAAVVRVPTSAPILKTAGTGFTKSTAADLADGAKVKVWFNGPVAESYPVQATAGTVVIQ